MSVVGSVGRRKGMPQNTRFFLSLKSRPSHNKAAAGCGRLTAASDPTGLIAYGAWERICYRDRSGAWGWGGLGPVRQTLGRYVKSAGPVVVRSAGQRNRAERTRNQPVLRLILDRIQGLGANGQGDQRSELGPISPRRFNSSRLAVARADTAHCVFGTRGHSPSG